MSGTVAAAGIATYGTLGRILADGATARARVDALTRQAGDGLVGDSFAALGSGAQTSLDLRPQLAHQLVWQGNIDAASTKMQLTQTAMSQIGQIAADFYARTNSLDGQNPSDVDVVAAAARDALRQVAGLLDTTDGTGYVFAGQDSGNPPVPNPDAILSSGFYTQINAAVGALATNGAAVTAATTLGLAGSNAAGTSPFSAYLSQPAAGIGVPTVALGEQQRQTVGIVASANADAVSVGGSTTGSYMRDLLRGLATLGSLSSTQVSAAGFAGLVADTRTSLGGVVDALNTDAGILGNRQSQLDVTKTRLGDVATALTGQVSSVEDVDMAKTLSNLTAAQTQLQSSYQVIAAMKSLSLANFL